MLDPDYIDQAGDMVAAVYGEIEADMLTHLCRLLLDQDVEGLGQRGLTALNLLAQNQGPYLLGIIRSHSGEVNEAIARTVEDAIQRSDRNDAARLGTDEWLEAAMHDYPRQVRMTTQGIAAILERDNVDMAQGALDLWNRCVAEAVTNVNTGAETAERAIHEAVRRMMREGVSTVTYRDPTTGRQTVTNRIDVAVRRHVRTQIAQDGMRRTLDVCGQAGIRLVEVSSHGGARPEHARWQGRVYSLDGTVEVGGKTYKDFYAETGYGKVDGLGGANCRHSFGPWIPGTPRKYDPEPSHPSGLDNDEIYKLTQGQRRRERDIRQTKRELSGAQLIADKDASLANIAEVERLKAKLRGQQEGMRRYIDEANGRGRAPVLQRSPRREWAGDMPRVRKTDASRRTMKEFMESDGVKRALKARGASESAVRKAIAEELKAQGLEGRSWKYLSRSNQQNIFQRVLAKFKPPKKSGKAATATARVENAFGMASGNVNLAGLPSEIERQVADSAEMLASRFPKMAGHISEVSTCDPAAAPRGCSKAYAWCYPISGKIQMNLKYFGDAATLRSMYQKDVAAGFHPPGCDERQIFVHEFCHAIDGFLARSGKFPSTKGHVSSKIRGQIMRRCGLKVSDIPKEVSLYGASNAAEWFAEALSEAICSSNPRPVATELLKWVEDAMKAV